MGDGHVIGTGLDYGIIIAYFVIILGFGAFFGKSTKTTKDFFFGGQRFAWWLIAFSLVATTVGSYSFVKYAAVAFSYGLSSTHSYLNDWFWMPLFMLGWLPIIYYSRITSVPEYFERRFDRKARLMATVIMLIYLVGYLGINFYTLGVALNALLGWPVLVAAVVIAVICAIYVTAGGQTSVIMTDLIQGVLLLGAGFLLFWLGLQAVGGLDSFWSGIPYRGRLPLAYMSNPPDFNFLGILWQDGLAQSAFAYFLNQGIIMRFLAAKSVKEGRKAATFLLLGLQILAAIAVANAGWLARALATNGLLPEGADPNRIFVVVANMLCSPGVFGFVMAALTAALMSTADTLINATSAVFVNDVWKLYVRPQADDRHYLRVARWVSVAAAGIGVTMVPIYASFKSIYAAHGAFTAAIGPPMAVAGLIGAFWWRFTPKAAFWTILGGTAAIAFSIAVPDVLAPFAFGTERSGAHFTTWSWSRALYGIVVSSAIGVTVSVFTTPRPRETMIGVVWGTIREAQRRFKGAEPNEEPGRTVRVVAVVVDDADQQQTPEGRFRVRLADQALAAMKARPGDLIHVSDRRFWLGGLRSIEAVAVEGGPAGQAQIPRAAVEMGGLRPGELVRIEKTL